jgi:hypothetical protein
MRTLKRKNVEDRGMGNREWRMGRGGLEKKELNIQYSTRNIQ